MRVGTAFGCGARAMVNRHYSLLGMDTSTIAHNRPSGAGEIREGTRAARMAYDIFTA